MKLVFGFGSCINYIICFIKLIDSLRRVGRTVRPGKHKKLAGIHRKNFRPEGVGEGWVRVCIVFMSYTHIHTKPIPPLTRLRHIVLAKLFF